MLFSEQERTRRVQVAQDIIAKNDLKAMFILGDDKAGNEVFGDLRYFTANRVFFIRQCAVFFADSEPVHFSGGDFQTVVAKKESIIKNCIGGGDNYINLINLFKERGVTKGRVGTSLETMSAAGLLKLQAQLPGIELVDVHKDIMDARKIHSQEENDLIITSGKLCDGAYEALLRSAKAGMTDSDVTAEIDYYMRKHGVEENFTLVSSGKFSLHNNPLPLPRVAPEHARTIENGDVISLEITPKYGGYWTQLVRNLPVGEPNSEMAKIHRVTRMAISACASMLKGGNTIAQACEEMKKAVEADGQFMLSAPLGHICAIDLVESRVAFDNHEPLIPGTAVIVHPMISTKDGTCKYYCGETYMVTDDGCQRLSMADDDIKVVR